MPYILLWDILNFLALARCIKPLKSQSHIFNTSWEDLANVQEIVSCREIRASLGVCETLLNIPHPLMALLGC